MKWFIDSNVLIYWTDDSTRADIVEKLLAADASISVQVLNEFTNVLDSPLMALLHFMKALRQCPGAPDVKAGDVITTGTWTDAWPLVAGQAWESRYDSPLTGLKISLV